jgi:hypothetical protein
MRLTLQEGLVQAGYIIAVESEAAGASRRHAGENRSRPRHGAFLARRRNLNAVKGPVSAAGPVGMREHHAVVLRGGGAHFRTRQTDEVTLT